MTELKYKIVKLIWDNKKHNDILASIYNKAYHKEWPKNLMCKLLDSPGILFFIVINQINKNIIGFMIARMVIDEAELIDIAIAPEYQNKGIGNSFLLGLTSFLKNTEVKTIYLEVSYKNFCAISLYKKFGFKVTGKRSGYYNLHNDKNSDAFLMKYDI